MEIYPSLADPWNWLPPSLRSDLVRMAREAMEGSNLGMVEPTTLGRDAEELAKGIARSALGYFFKTGIQSP